MTRRSWRAALVALPLVACAPALREPPSVDRMGADLLEGGDPAATAGDVDGLLAEADAAFARRPDAVAVHAAERAYFQAARADAARVEGLVGLARVSVWRLEHSTESRERQALVPLALRSAQWCARRRPEDARCDFWLAVALGLQAREQPSTGHDGVARMVDALRRAIDREPGVESAGPHRVLALVLLRAPGWPVGPGDAEAALREAEAAVALFPDHPPNQTALGEALRRNGRPDDSRQAYSRARDRARALAAADPDARDWEEEATQALSRP